MHEAELARDAGHRHVLGLEAGQFVYAEADQRSVDVVIAVTGPDGTRVNGTDQTGRGPEEPFSDLAAHLTKGSFPAPIGTVQQRRKPIQRNSKPRGSPSAGDDCRVCTGDVQSWDEVAPAARPSVALSWRIPCPVTVGPS